MGLMRRQSLVKFDAPLCETIVDTPKPQGKEVLVRIERCGLCHSDLHIQDGYADLGGGKKLDTTRGMTLPFTLGHEIAGVVEEVGPDVSKDLIGTKKAVFPWIGCGQCRDCLNGDENLCLRQRFLGVAIDGGFASHVLVPDAKYLLDYDPLPVNQAATLMCSGVTAYGALKRLVDRPRQRNLLLIGLGGVGMMGLAFAQAMFKQKISVADLSPAAREAALSNGAAMAYDPTEADIGKRMMKETEGGFDAIVDFAGNEKSMAFRGVGGGARRQDRGLRSDGRQFQPADGAMDLQAHDHRGIHGRHPGGSRGTDGAGPRGQDQADADEGRTDGGRPEMDRRTAGRQSGWTYRAEELTRERLTRADRTAYSNRTRRRIKRAGFRFKSESKRLRLRGVTQGETSMVGVRPKLVALAALVFAAWTMPALAQKQYGPGVTDTEIKIGTTTPYSGPASAYAAGAISATAFFRDDQ